MQAKIDNPHHTSKTARTIARIKKQPRMVLIVETNLTDSSRLINKASLRLAELIAQQIARDVLCTQAKTFTHKPLTKLEL